jgi:hypothetical protein
MPAISPGQVTSTPTSGAPTPTVAPLTGLPGAKARPVVVVKIENSARARPQSGLQAADIVVEELVEGGLTRFAAFYQSVDPGQVGPVRSARHVDAAIAGPTHGILAFSGGAGPALAVVSRSGLHLVQEGDPSGAFSRLRTRSAPHNLYLRVGTLWVRPGSGVPPAYLPFTSTGSSASAPGVAQDAPATSAVLAFSAVQRPSWTFDRARGCWWRSETGGHAAVSAGGARQVADNVLILRVRIRDAGYPDPAGNLVPETVFTGTGGAVLLHGGRRVTGTWSKSSPLAELKLTGADGRPLLLSPGRTWIELVPVQGGVWIR